MFTNNWNNFGFLMCIEYNKQMTSEFYLRLKKVIWLIYPQVVPVAFNLLMFLVINPFNGVVTQQFEKFLG